MNEKGAKNFSLWTTFCVRRLKCIIPSSCSCQDKKCVSDYDYDNEEFYEKTDTEKIENVFMTRLEAQKNCDIELSHFAITGKIKRDNSGKISGSGSGFCLGGVKG